MTPAEFVAKWSRIQQKETAVLEVHSWPYGLTDEQISERLLALNLERADRQE